MSHTEQADPHSPSTGQGMVTSRGSVLAVAAAGVEAAFLGHHEHIFIWRQFGGGAPSSSRVRLSATDLSPSTGDAGLVAADRPPLEESPFS